MVVTALTSQDNIQTNYPIVDEYVYNRTKKKERNIDLHSEDVFLISTENFICTFDDDDLSYKNKSFEKNTILNNLLANFYNIIDQNREYYYENNINLPNDYSLAKLETILDKLIIKNIYPSKISTSVEEGVCITLKKDDKKLHFEIYNDGDMGYIIENYVSKTIIENKDIENLEWAIISLVNFENDEIS